MKKFFTLCTLLLSMTLFSQNLPPVAVNDTLDVYLLDDTVTIQVTQNDYDPESDPFIIYWAGGSIAHTDSTITYVFPYQYYWRHNGLEKFLSYTIYDPVNTPDSISMAWVYANFHNPYFDSLDINGVNARINNNGNHFWDLDGDAKYFVPNGSTKTAIFSFALWLGGLDAGENLHLAAERYGGSGHDYYPGPVSDTIHYSNIYDSAWSQTWKINRSEIEYHKSHWWIGGYAPPASILTWPGNGNTSLGQQSQLAPYHDSNNNGIYEPMSGDYPLIKGDQTVFFIMNDTRRPHTETGGQKVGMEIHAMAYAFDCPDDSALWYTTFLHYDIYNRSANTYHDTYLGAFVDTDLGDAWDDYVGCDVPRSSFFSYNGDNYDGTGLDNEYGAFPPAISTTMLAGPFLDPDNLDNPKLDSLGNPLCDLSINGAYFEDGVMDNERFGMNHFIYAMNSGSGPTSDPETASEYYQFLRVIWKDGLHMKYGGNGHPNAGSDTLDCNFMFPATTDFCNWGTNGIQPPGYITGAGGTGISWTEGNVGNPPYDKRGTITMGPFTFNPGDKQELDLAFVWARQYTDSAATAVIPLLGNRIDQIRSYFSNDTTPCGGSFSGIASHKGLQASLKVYPNPASNLINIEYSNGHGQAVYFIFNLLGEIKARNILQQHDVHQVSLDHYTPGMYFLVVRDANTIRTARFIKK